MTETASDALPTLAEDMQLVLSRGGGVVAQGYSDVAAAALVELAILGRIDSEPPRGFLADKSARKLVVIDSTPTGVPILDEALRRVAKRSSPWNVRQCIGKVQGAVSRMVIERLIERGALRWDGRPGRWKSTLLITDEAQYLAAVSRRDTAFFNPEAVSHPREAAFVDLVRNANEMFRIGERSGPVALHGWYPPELRETIVVILEIEALLTASGGGGGYEG